MWRVWKTFAVCAGLLALGCGSKSSVSKQAPPLYDAPEDPPRPATAEAKVSRDVSVPKDKWNAEGLGMSKGDPPTDVRQPPPTALKTQGGVSYVVIKAGKTGVRPKRSDEVLTHYSGWTTDGKLFDSSIQRGEPLKLPVSGVIPGWIDALTRMEVGDVWRIWIPEELAYKGREGAPKGMLVFEMALLKIVTK